MDTWHAWSKIKQTFVATSFFLGIIAMGGFILWVLILPRSWQLMKWSPVYMYILILFSIIFLLIPIGAVLDLRYRLNKGISSKKIPGKYIYVLFLTGIILPTSYLIYLTPYAHSGDKPPQLLIIDQTGSAGTPDLAVVFYTQSKTINYLDYGEDSLNLKTHIVELEKSNTHGIILADLLPSTKYFYQINGKGIIYNFTSFPLLDYRFAFTSDFHIGSSENNATATQNILSQIADPAANYNAFFSLGDIVEMGNNDKLYQEQMKLFSPVTTHIPFQTVIGNHDAWFGGVTLWKENFYPESLPTDSSDSQLWHRFDFGSDIHVFMLDLEWGTESYTEEQKAWFEAELKSLNPNDWIIIMNHAYYYASSTTYSGGISWADNSDMIRTFNPLFQQYGVDLVFTGHDHQMEHIAQDSVDYFIVGAGGGPHDEDPTIISSNSQFFDNQHYGYLDLQFSSENATLAFRTPDNVILYNVTVAQ